MKIKQALTVGITKKVLHGIEKLINLQSAIKGQENIPKSASIIFAPNHFTRAETFIIPYFLNKINGLKFSRSLAHDSLFSTPLRAYLRNLKTVSTKDTNRDQTIISDLSQNKYNWVIYPEGQMVKDKARQSQTGLFQNQLTFRTGTAVLAMKAEIARQEKGLPKPICIVPTTISYIPIHPKQNKILSIAKRLIKKLPKTLEEELLVEGSILLNSTIIIHFHKPIYVSDYILKELYIHKLLGKSTEALNNVKIEKYRVPIATKIADEIYLHAQITHQHIISLLLQSKKGKIEKSQLGFLIVACVLELQKHSNIQEFAEEFAEDRLYSFLKPKFCVEEHLSLLQTQEVITQTENEIEITPKFHEKHQFNTVRIENIARVFLNEINYFKNTNEIAKQILKMSKMQIFNVCIAGLEELHLTQHKKTFNLQHSIAIENSRPTFLEGKQNAVLLVHGYKASPREVHDVAKFLHKKGFSCYCVRMSGHGTSPFDMASKTHENWLSSVETALLLLQFAFNDINLLGFSTGGLICMQLSTLYKCKSLTLINSAIAISDIRFRFVKVANFWSDLASKFSKNHKGYITDTPFHPETNYAINHFSCMAELSLLMEKCKDNMEKITIPTLIIQSSEDPVIQPKSGKIIYDSIASQEKRLEIINSNQHVITRGKNFLPLQPILQSFLL